jgi:hypothetical protein
MHRLPLIGEILRPKAVFVARLDLLQANQGQRPLGMAGKVGQVGVHLLDRPVNLYYILPANVHKILLLMNSLFFFSSSVLAHRKIIVKFLG